MILLLLASGRGSRLRSLTEDKPKCLVKVNRKPILYYSLSLFEQFDKIFFITGYKSNEIKKYIGKNNKYKFFYNKDYKSTNMVHSLFHPYKEVKEDLVVIYSDIIFDKNILKELIIKKGTTMPIKSNWYEYWCLRMGKDKVKSDAEDLMIGKKHIKSIGKKIMNKLPKHQFMGIMKFALSDYKKMYKIYKKLKNENIDLTNFINHSIIKYNVKVKHMKTGRFWLEIDNKKDIKIANKIIKTQKI